MDIAQRPLMFHEVNILHLLNHPLVRDDDILTQWPSPTAAKTGRGWWPRVLGWCYYRRHWAEGHGVGPRPSLVGGTAMVRAKFCMGKVRARYHFFEKKAVP